MVVAVVAVVAVNMTRVEHRYKTFFILRALRIKEKEKERIEQVT